MGTPSFYANYTGVFTFSFSIKKKGLSNTNRSIFGRCNYYPCGF